MRFSYLFYLFLVAGLYCISCNKNSDQLPPVKILPDSFRSRCFINDKEVDIIFLHKKTAVTDSVWAYFQSQCNESISGLRAVVEVCETLPHNYDNCHMQMISSANTLQPHDTAGLTLLFAGNTIVMDSNHIAAGILSASIAGNTMAGIYKNNGASFIKDTVGSFAAIVKGYVLYDGNMVLRVKQDVNYYTIAGRIVPPGNSVINALELRSETAAIQSLQQDTFRLSTDTLAPVYNIYVNADSLTFRVKGASKPVLDSFQTIFINLLKN